MARVLFAFVAAACIFFTCGCAALSGDVTPAMQKAKKDALQKVADDHKDPNRQDRGSR